MSLGGNPEHIHSSNPDLGAKAAGIRAEGGVASRILALEPLDWFGPLNPDNAAFKPPMCLGKACPLPRVKGCQAMPGQEVVCVLHQYPQECA